MKTTLELPDELMRRVKIRAAENNQKLKDTFAELIQKGISLPSTSARRELPTPVKLSSGPLTEEQIEEAIRWGRD
jgi:hypothetical protein